MDSQIFWNVIEMYNKQTIIIQSILLIFIVLAIILSYSKKINWIAKAALGIGNLFIGIVFFGLYGVEPIQKYFALPLYLCCGMLFLFDSIKSKDDVLNKPNRWQSILIILYIAYPFISFALGNRFPRLVTYLMPCPIISLSIAVYSCYHKKNKILLVLLTIWGLTGIKSSIFNVYEDVILLVCGIYGIYLIYREYKNNRHLKMRKKT
jgi:hypothetical protein